MVVSHAAVTDYHKLDDLKQPEVYSVTVLEPRSPTQFHWPHIKTLAEPQSLQECRGESISHLFFILVASGILWIDTLSHSSRPTFSNFSLMHIHIAFSSIYVQIYFFLALI